MKSLSIDRLGRKRNSRHTSRGQGGGTLVESVMTLTLVALMSTLIGRLILTGVRTQERVETRSELLSAARRTVYLMEREIREIVKPEDIQSASSVRLSFLKRGTDDTVYDYNPSNGKLERNDAPILSGITEFSFTYERPDGAPIVTPSDSLIHIWNIHARLTVAHKGERVTMESSVHPRNF